MANLGNAWHLPGNTEPRGSAGMRDPVFPTSPVPEVTIITGNQFTGIGGNPGNQLQDGSALFFRRVIDAGWQTVPLMFASTVGNNKYYSGQIPTGAFAPDAVIRYYLRIAYDDHATTFLQVGADGISSVVTGDETAAQAAPFTFTIDTPDKRGQWGETFSLRNVGIHGHVLPTGLTALPDATRLNGLRDYSPSVLYDVDRVIFIGGGNPPTGNAEIIDLSQAQPAWQATDSMNFSRRQHNATILPDGTVLVTGGTRSGGAVHLGPARRAIAAEIVQISAPAGPAAPALQAGQPGSCPRTRQP